MTPPDDTGAERADVDPARPVSGGRSGHRTWPERLTILGTFLSAALCFLVALALVGGYLVARQRNVVDLENPADRAVTRAAAEAPIIVLAGEAGGTTAGPSTTAAGTGSTTTAAASALASTPSDAPAATEPAPAAADAAVATGTEPASAPTATFPPVDPEAQNFLITGADNGACVDPNSPYAGAFGDRQDMGERSDTIMVLRVDPSSKRVAILSFPRDLYVEIADTGNKSRINSAYQRDDPQRLADTIYNNFGVPIDHYIQVDFCAFKTLVDAVGGVSVPFEYPTRDTHTGLDVPAAGCYAFDGESALAYVRSRYYEYEDPPGSGDWHRDGTSDRGRISRQQDFLRRVLSSVLDKGPLNPSVARGLIRAATHDVVTDRDLTPAKMMEFAGVMNDVDANSIVTYQIEATGRNINGASVLIPSIDGENMQAVLALFSGRTSLADMPEQIFADTTTTAPRGATTTTVAPSAIVGATDVTGTDAGRPRRRAHHRASTPKRRRALRRRPATRPARRCRKARRNRTRSASPRPATSAADRPTDG